MSLKLKVECYSGYKADERPIRFTPLAAHGRTYEVAQVLDQWYGPDYQCFKVRADDGNLYVLRHNPVEGEWTLDSFRKESEANSQESE